MQEARFQQLLDEQSRRGCQLLILLAATLFPAFALLDYFTQYPDFFVLSAIRLSTSFLYVLLYFACLRGWFPRKPYPSALFVLALAAASITLMCLMLRGYQSRYYAGVNLVILAAGLIFPWNARQMGLAVLMIFSIYATAVLVQAGLPLASPDTFINNISFLAATGIISTASAHFHDSQRRESFARYAEIENARDFLRADLASGQNSLETLLNEIAQRKSDLEEASLSLRQARDQAQVALSHREEFISIASHELKTPLTSMRLQTQLLYKSMQKGQEIAPDKTEKMLETLDKQTARLAHLVDGIFDTSAIRSGKLEIQPARTELVEIVREVVDQIKNRAREEGVELRAKFPQTIHGSWDAMRIQQVVSNLLTNALKYGHHKPVDISLAAGPSHAEIRVRDQGPGIARPDQERIFERFERGHSAQHVTGLGLGLYICREIARAHGGEIFLESSIGEGSTFTVRLPLEVRAHSDARI